jgi:hypothetical protein
MQIKLLPFVLLPRFSTIANTKPMHPLQTCM